MSSDEAQAFGGFNPDGVDVALDLVADLASVPPTLPPPRLGPDRPKRKVVRRSSGALEPLGDVVGEVAADRGWQSRMSLHLLQVRWDQLAGDINAMHSQPVALKDKVVTVSADSSTWASALRLIAPQLVARLNQALGDGSVTAVDIVGPQGPDWKHGKRAVRDGRGPRDTYG